MVNQNMLPHDGDSISLSLKIRNLILFIKCLRIEFYMFIFNLMYTMTSIPMAQLFQDKICRFKFNQSEDFCSQMSEMDKDHPGYHYKSEILAESTQMNMYTFVIALCPSIIWSLLFGSWIDKYYHAKKFLLLFSVFIQALDALLLALQSVWFQLDYRYILLSVVPEGITGTSFAALIALNSYISVVTPARFRALRMAFIEICLLIASPLANFLVGFLIDRPAVFGNGQLHNYSLIFLISAGSGTIAFFWVLFLLDEKRDKKRLDEYAEMIENQENGGVKKSKVKDEKKQEYVTNVNPIKLLFNFSNIKDIFGNSFKIRKNKGRGQLWLCFLSMCIFVISHYGPAVFSYQFNQKVYNWGPAKQSYVQTIGSMVSPIMFSLTTLILVKILKVEDMTLGMIGIVSYTIQGIILGTFLTEIGNYVSILLSVNGGLTVVGIKTHLSKIIPKEDLGKVFSLLASLQCLAPLLSAVFFTSIFRVTMDTMPGLCYQIASLLLMIAFYSLVWIDLNNKSKESDKLNAGTIEQKFRENQTTKL